MSQGASNNRLFSFFLFFCGILLVSLSPVIKTPDFMAGLSCLSWGIGLFVYSIPQRVRSEEKIVNALYHISMILGGIFMLIAMIFEFSSK